jgi:hypothetical protein
MDRVDQHESYEPAEHYALDLADSKLTDEELAAKQGRGTRDTDGEDTDPPKPRRLDG